MRPLRRVELLLPALLASSFSHAVSQLYSATELTQFEGAYPAYLGEQGQVVGSQPSNRPIQWSPTTGVQYLPLYGGTQYMQPRGVSKDGVILANSSNNTIMFAINPDFSYTPYPWTGGGFTNVYPTYRNRNGALLFDLWTGQNTVHYLANSSSGAPEVLNGNPTSINDNGQIVMSGKRRLVDGTLQTLNVPAGLSGGGYFINESGFIAGGSQNAANTAWNFDLWDPSNQLIAHQPLGVCNDGQGSVLWNLNDQNVAVGTSGFNGVRKAVKWSFGFGVEDLNALTPDLPSSITLTWAQQVNNRGEILCQGTKAGHDVWVYLQPVPEPGTWLALGFGVGALGARRRKKSAGCIMPKR